MSEESIKDVRCKASSIKKISKATCKNNCSYFMYDVKVGKRVCSLGYK